MREEPAADGAVAVIYPEAGTQLEFVGGTTTDAEGTIWHQVRDPENGPGRVDSRGRSRGSRNVARPAPGHLCQLIIRIHNIWCWPLWSPHHPTMSRRTLAG